MVINQEPPSPRAENPEAPKDLETICLKAMSKSSEHRFTDCDELADDLRRWQEGEPILARRISPLERTGRWCRRNPATSDLPTVSGAYPPKAGRREILGDCHFGKLKLGETGT